MKKTLALVAVAILAIPTAQAAIITQTLNYSNLGATAQSPTWNKFDLNLGTLTRITFIGSGTLSGSYDVINNDTVEAAVFSANATSRIRLALTGSSPAIVIQGSLLNPISTSPASTSGASVPAGGAQTFTLLSGTGVNVSSFDSTQTANSAFYSALGGGTFGSQLTRFFSATIPGDNSTDTTSLVAGGSITLEYEYTPVGPAPIPEPGTWAAAALLVGGAAFARWRKRQTA
jgi:hypothetical protein